MARRAFRLECPVLHLYKAKRPIQGISFVVLSRQDRVIAGIPGRQAFVQPIRHEAVQPVSFIRRLSGTLAQGSGIEHGLPLVPSVPKTPNFGAVQTFESSGAFSRSTACRNDKRAETADLHERPEE